MLDWVTYSKELSSRVGQIGKLSPDTLKGYMALSHANAQTGTLDAKTRELMSLAVAVALRCDGCITVHTAQAAKLGATEAEVAEALGIAIAISAGAALVYSARTLDALAAHQAK